MIQRLLCTSLFLPLLALLLVLAPTSDCGAAQWGMYQHDPQHTGKGTGVGPSSAVAPKMKSEVKRFVAGTAIGDDGTIYAADQNNAYALNPDGSIKHTLPNIGVCCSPPVIGPDGTIYFSGNALYAVDPDTFSIKWVYGPGATCCGTMIVGPDGTIYVANGALHAVKPDGVPKWVFTSTDGSTVAAAPSLSHDGTTVYVATEKYLYFLNSSSPTTLAVVRSQIPITNYAGTAPLVDQSGTIYIPSFSSILAVDPSGVEMRTIQLDLGKQVANMAYDAQNGSLICTVYAVQMNSSGEVPPVLWNADGDLLAIDPITAAVRWAQPLSGGMDVVMDMMPYAKPIIDVRGWIYLATGVYSAPGIETGVHFYGFAPSGDLMFDYYTQATQPSGPLPPSDTRLPTMANDGTIFLLLDGAVQAFGPENGIIITATAGPNGFIDPTGPVPVQLGANMNFMIIANPGYTIADILVDGVSIIPINPATGVKYEAGPSFPYTFSNVTADHTISATFKTQTFTITASAGTGGTISPAGATTASSGDSKSFSISANPGYLIADVLVDGVSVGPLSSYTFANVTGNHTISVTFALPVINLTAPNGGEVWKKNSSQTIAWTFTGPGGTQVKIDLLKGGVLYKNISKGTSVGSNGRGSFNWKVPSTLTNGSDYTIRVTSTTNSAFTDTSSSFTITK